MDLAHGRPRFVLIPNRPLGMKPTHLLFLTLAAAASAADLDVPALGRDLNGWTRRGVAAYGVNRTTFELTRPTLSRGEQGELRIECVLSQPTRGGKPFEATLELLVAPHGDVQSVSIRGMLGGKSFDAGTATRPVVEEAPAPEESGEEAEKPAESTAEPATRPEPVDPDAELRKDALSRLSSALERARSSKRVVKRDVSSWVFGAEVADDETIGAAARAALEALFRRTHR